MKAKIGSTTEGKPINLNVSADLRMLITANSGGGKSWLMRLIVESGCVHFETEGEEAGRDVIGRSENGRHAGGVSDARDDHCGRSWAEKRRHRHPAPGRINAIRVDECEHGARQAD